MPGGVYISSWRVCAEGMRLAQWCTLVCPLPSPAAVPTEGKSSQALPPALRAAIPEDSLTPEREQAWLAWVATYQAA
jgi:hypothetical protein